MLAFKAVTTVLIGAMVTVMAWAGYSGDRETRIGCAALIVVSVMSVIAIWG